MTFIGADVDVETGAKGGALLGSQYVRAESFKWRAAAPALAVSLVQRFNASQLSGYLQAGRGARVAVLSSTADAAGYTLAELLHASVPLLVVNAGAYTQQHAQMASYGALRRRWEVSTRCSDGGAGCFARRARAAKCFDVIKAISALCIHRACPPTFAGAYGIDRE